MTVPVEGLRIKLIPTDEELDACRAFGTSIGRALIGDVENRIVEMVQR